MTDQPDLQLPVLNTPTDGVPAVVDSAQARLDALEALTLGRGPVAVDVERAQSYRYSSKAYLVQLRRPGSGTLLIDPIAFEAEGTEVAHFAALQELIGDEEWIVHAATQDLPNLVLLGLRPTRLFDTELAGRLLGLPRVSLGAMAERFCGVRLLKEHSAVDWSTRPIPHDWLNYAALDVELLHELREHLLAELVATDKQEWARQEFDWLCRWAMLPPALRPDRWRRTSGSHQVRTPRGMAVVRELWLARDEIARANDRAPGRIVPDAAIAELGALVTRQQPRVPTEAELRSVNGFKRRTAREHLSEWLAALDRVSAMPTHQLPPVRLASTGIPMPRNWENAKPAAWQRWNQVRPAVLSLAEDLQLPVENLVSPEALRQLLWEPREPLDVNSIAQQLADLEARAWQRDLIAPLVAELLG